MSTLYTMKMVKLSNKTHEDIDTSPIRTGRETFDDIIQKLVQFYKENNK